MTLPVVATVAAAVGTLLGLSMALPQALVIWRDRSYVGVSRSMWILQMLVWAGWIAYGVRSADPVIAATNTLNVLTCFVLIVGVLRADGRTAFASLWLVGLLALGAGASAFAALAPLSIVIALLLAGALARTSQVWSSIVTWRSARASEVSTTTWWVSLATGICFLVYGLLHPAPAVAVSSAILVVTAVAVLRLERAASRRRARPAFGDA